MRASPNFLCSSSLIMSATEEGGEEQELDSEDMIAAVLALLSKILDAPPPPHSMAGDSQLLILAILRPFFSSIARRICKTNTKLFMLHRRTSKCRRFLWCGSLVSTTPPQTTMLGLEAAAVAALFLWESLLLLASRQVNFGRVLHTVSPPPFYAAGGGKGLSSSKTYKKLLPYAIALTGKFLRRREVLI